RDPRFARQRAQLDPRARRIEAEEASDLTIRLSPPQLFEGQVFAEDTGKPLSFARVSLVPCEPRARLPGLREHVDARADADARFPVHHLPGTAFKVNACAPEGAR